MRKAPHSADHTQQSLRTTTESRTIPADPQNPLAPQRRVPRGMPDAVVLKAREGRCGNFPAGAGTLPCITPGSACHGFRPLPQALPPPPAPLTRDRGQQHGNTPAASVTGPNCNKQLLPGHRPVPEEDVRERPAATPLRCKPPVLARLLTCVLYTLGVLFSKWKYWRPLYFWRETLSVLRIRALGTDSYFWFRVRCFPYMFH